MPAVDTYVQDRCVASGLHLTSSAKLDAPG